MLEKLKNKQKNGEKLVGLEKLLMKHLDNNLNEQYFKPDEMKDTKLQKLKNIISNQCELDPDELETYK